MRAAAVEMLVEKQYSVPLCSNVFTISLSSQRAPGREAILSTINTKM